MNAFPRFLLAFGVMLLVFTTAARAEEANIRTITLNIDAQPLADALNAFAQQSGLQVVFYSKVGEGLRTDKLSGTYSAEVALARLLANTPLAYEFINPRTIAIRSRAGVDLQKSENGISKTASETAMRLAEAKSDSDNSEIPRQYDKGITHRNSAEKSEGVPEMLVKGSKVLNADIRRTEDDIQPYVVFGAEEIRRSQAVNLESFLKTRLPMNTVQITNSQVDNRTSSNASQINLRGLGTNQTLILVDGRRMPNYATFTASNQADINGVPLAAVERVEVLPSTASGIYGGSATGGVINIITRKDYAGLDFQATYGNTFDSDVANRRMDVSGGFSFEGGKTHVRIAGSYADANPLLVGDRDFAARGRALQLAKNPSAFFAPITASTLPRGSTSNIRNASPNQNTNLVLKPGFGGAALSSPFTFVPVGYAGPAVDGAAPLLANAGQYNLALPKDGSGSELSLLNDPRVDSASLNLRREFGSHIEAFIDGSWLRNKGRISTVSFFANDTSVTLAASAPNNPFTTAVNMSFPLPHLEYRAENTVETLRAVGGAIVRLPREWTAAADYVWSRARLSSSAMSSPLGDPDGAGPGISAATALANGALNIMRDINAFPLNYSPYLMPSPSAITYPSDTVLMDATLRLSGPLLHLPGGTLNLSGLVERREEDAKDQFSERITSSSALTLVPGRKQKVDSYYLEARAPLISQDNAYLRNQMLEMQVSVRRDEYQTRAPSPTSATVSSLNGPFPALTYSTNEVEATKYTVGLSYMPVKDLALRASFGTGFLPPSIAQVVPTPSTVPAGTSLIDPKRGSIAGGTGSFSVLALGNPNLNPEESESLSLGAIFTPRVLPGLRLSIDYTRIEKTDEIFQPSAQQMLDLEDFFPVRVVRASLTAQDIASGYTGGVITFMDRTAVNLSRARIEAYDTQADYTLATERFGELHFYAIATWQPHFERQTSPISSLVEFADFSDGVLKWRGNAGLDWQHGPWTIGWNGQYYHSYFAYTSTAISASIDTIVLSQGSRRIPSQMYHDLLGAYRFGESIPFAGGLLKNTEVSLGIQNLFNEIPPIIATTGTNGGYSTYGDPRLRRYSLTLRKEFH